MIGAVACPRSCSAYFCVTIMLPRNSRDIGRRLGRLPLHDLSCEEVHLDCDWGEQVPRAESQSRVATGASMLGRVRVGAEATFQIPPTAATVGHLKSHICRCLFGAREDDISIGPCGEFRFCIRSAVDDANQHGLCESLRAIPLSS